jgi:hypothetical protein
MKSPVFLAVLVLAVALLTHTSRSQESVQNNNTPLSQISPFVSPSAGVAEGTSLTYAAAYPVLGDGVFPVFAHVGIGFSSVFELSYTNEGVIANALGFTNPMNYWGAKLQIIPPHEQFPSLAIYMKGTIGWESQFLGSNDFQARIPDLYNQGLYSTSYEFSSNTAGLSMESRMTEALTVRFTVGVQEIRSRNLWILIAPAPFFGNGFHDTQIHNSLILDGSASASFVLRPKLALIGELFPLPYYTIDVPTNSLKILRAFTGLVGLRYSLSPMLNLDTYVRQQSTVSGIAFTQFRLGISGLVSIVP